VRLEDQSTHTTFRLYNTHMPLKAEARENAAKLIAQRMDVAKATEPLLLLGDFNCGPGSAPWKTFEDAGLVSTGAIAKNKKGSKTYHVAGVALSCIDGIFVKGLESVNEHRVLDSRFEKVYPSDHFGIAAEIVLPKGTQKADKPAPTPTEKRE